MLKCTKNNMNRNESGRSMVEMLGVLAVIGVLSVAGIAGFNTAMNKYHANELLNEASKRAVVVAGQLMNKDTASLSGFSGQKVSGGTFTDETVTRDENNQFTLTITGVDESVCKQMKNTITPAIQKFEPEDCARSATVKLTYNAGLTTEATTQSVIDSSIDNAEDCQSAGKTWCRNAMAEDSSNGVCSNVTDCCKTVTLNSCQTCQSVQGQYVVDYKLPTTSCDYRGKNDGLCMPYAPTNEPCEGDILNDRCLNGVKYEESETVRTCAPISCTDFGDSEMVSSCANEICSNYGQEGLESMMGGLITALNSNPPDFSVGVALIDQINVAQCTICNDTDGSLTSAPDETECRYLEGERLLSNYDPQYPEISAVTLPGACKKGKCNKINGFFGYGVWTGSHNLPWSQRTFYECDEPREIVTEDTHGACKDLCPNRKMTSITNDGDGVCSLNCPSGTFALAPGQSDDCAFCGNPNPHHTPNSEADCLACGNRHIDENGKCVMDHCPTGYFRGAFTCVPCDYQEDTSYDFETRSSTQSKADCDKCENDGAHIRTYHSNGMCRY